MRVLLLTKVSLYIRERTDSSLLLLPIVSILMSCGAPSGAPAVDALPAVKLCEASPSSVSIRRWLENPRTSAGNPSLYFSASLSPASTVPGILFGLSGDCLLQSQMFSLTQDGFFPEEVVVPSEPFLDFAPGTPQFRQLNAFHAVSELQGRAASLGIALEEFPRVEIDAHCRIANNAYYSPATNSVCLGYANVDPTSRIWAADDADVVIHEAGHSLNHYLASTAIFGSSSEASAVDEAVADYWALSIQGNSRLSEWFLGYLGVSRDAANSSVYPGAMQFQSHADSEVLSQTLWRLRAALGVRNSDAIVAKTISLLPQETRFAEFYLAYYEAAKLHFGVSDASDPSLSLVRAEFASRGIHRLDSAAGLALSLSQPYFVIDDHTLPQQEGGNCNGVLDVGETALLLVNLENSGAELGMGAASLESASAGLIIPSGGNAADFFRIGANASFVGSLPAGATRTRATSAASFLVRGSQAGPQLIGVAFQPMFADPLAVPSSAPRIQLAISLEVGSAPTQAFCSNRSLWP